MKSGTNFAWFIVLMFATLSIADHSFAYCSKPSAPSCALQYGAFDDQWEFDRCKRDIESFKNEVENFMRCNNDEAERAIRRANNENQSASSEYSDAVSSFNRRARSN
jgi:hypothetical protein